MDFISAFNTIMPDLLSDKVTQLSVSSSIFQWITSFLTDRQQLVRLCKLTSRTLTISTGDPQGCVLSPLFLSLYTNDCTSKDPSAKLLKFADNTTVIGLIKDRGAAERLLLCSSITVWFGSATKTDIRRLHQTVRSAERIIGAPLPSLQELYTSRVRKRAKKVTLDPHPQLTLSLNGCPLASATKHQNS